MHRRYGRFVTRPISINNFGWVAFVTLTALGLIALAMIRPFDHDESQYVAAALLSAGGLPYRDFAYLQTPLQPMLLAPLAVASGIWVWPVLRAVNALCGAVMLAACYAAARQGGATARPALLATALMACCDIFLFTSAVARNDAIPAMLLAIALWLAMRQIAGTARPVEAVAIGLVLSAATAAKISFALP
ncbi:MAG: hypothetical protein DI607_14990, partial [Sphingomonas hengshuiensis]